MTTFTLIVAAVLTTVGAMHPRSGPHVRAVLWGLWEYALKPGARWLALGPGGALWLIWRALALVLVHVALVALPGPTQLAYAGALGAAYYAGRAKHVRDPRWWSHRNLRDALADVARPWPTDDDGKLRGLQYLGQPVLGTDGSTTVTVRLPGALTARQVVDRRDALASRLQVPLDLLHVDDVPDADPGVLRVCVVEQKADAPEVLLPTRPSWSDVVTIGADGRGNPVRLQTDEHNVLIAGVPGSGKTSLARVFLGHYLLDPSAQIFLLDGKGSRRDYGDAIPMCTTYVSGVEEDAVERTEAMLGEVLDLVRARNAGTAPVAGTLLLLEEFQDIRSAADRATRARIDETLGRVVRMGRAVGVTVLVSTQRPSTDDLPSGVRNLIDQSVALMLRNGADAQLVLGETPSLPLPTRRGEALVRTSTGVRGARLVHLTDEHWQAVCSDASERRKAGDVAPARTVAGEAVNVDLDAMADPLLAEVVRALQDVGPEGLSAGALLGRLSDRVRPENPAQLGKRLARYPAYVKKGHAGTARTWRLASGAPTTSLLPAVVDVSPTRL